MRPSLQNAAVIQQVRQDAYFAEAGTIYHRKRQRHRLVCYRESYKIGFNRAARIMDQLAEAGVVGEEEGTKPRKVLMSPEAV